MKRHGLSALHGAARMLALGTVIVLASAVALVARAAVDSSVIRLKPAQPTPEAAGTRGQLQIEEPRRGFDYAAFEARLESMWFQRKIFLANGRHEDALVQLQQIRSFCEEEGVQRLENLAGALLAEAENYFVEGHHQQALDSLHYAEIFDPGRAQVHRARASVLWDADRDYLGAARELLRASRDAATDSLQTLGLLQRSTFVLVIACFGCLLLFSLLMLLRHQATARHEIEEWAVQFTDERLASALGWAILFLPLVLWVGAGWSALYWLVVAFRFMSRSERLTAVALLLAAALTAPIYRVGVALYGATADPAVRTTLASASGGYDPDRIVRLRQLVDGRPDDEVYRFLLASLYQDGRYFEEAFAQYKEALKLNSSLDPAHVNVGNIFYMTGQYPEAIRHYHQALEVNPKNFLAYFNMHLAQSEAFRFADAEASLESARQLDSARVAELLSRANEDGERPVVKDAPLKMASVWEAALAGSRPVAAASAAESVALGRWSRSFVNPTGIISLLALVACAGSVILTRHHAPAKRCIRCGRPFCRHCRSGREAQEYCSQCLHLYVLGNGLAPHNKSRKMYEIERYERMTRRGQRLLSWILPGSAYVLRGKAGWGAVILLLWVAALIAWQPRLLDPVEQLIGLRVHLDLVRHIPVPALFGTNLLGPLALTALLVIWLAGQGWPRRREA